jgi:hypothetical protein
MHKKFYRWQREQLDAETIRSRQEVAFWIWQLETHAYWKLEEVEFGEEFWFNPS